ncbi:MAG TPA: FAD-dependent oxidoreductase [Solirubrobacteraceae bacterium]|jgi:NADPH-dependent 2,4-dienoyl-CoA reductase/sulfur reductase-like enzyme/ferredoxin|nr:FAD-dependent oxidoreductase [Solirubrobacteraceae bacterium]
MPPEASAFPNYTQIAPVVPHAAWRVLRRLSVPLLVAIAVLLVADPKDGLKLWWGLLIPLLPLLWLVAPGIWRNVCPLATANQIPRTAGFSRAAKPPRWFRRVAPMLGMGTFVLAVASRPVLFNASGPATAALIVAALLGAFAGGVLLKGKSGWCSSICPMLPVQRMYGQAPFVLERNDHCRPCVGCTANCYDFNPRAAYLADLHEADPHDTSTRKIFVGAFPALVVAYFTLAPPSAVGVLTHYGQVALAIGAGIGSFFVLEAVLRVSAARLAAVYAAAAITLFYWYGSKVVATTLLGSPAGWLVWPLRTVVAGLAIAWLLRAWRQEQRFAAASAPAPSADAVSVTLSAAAQAAAAPAGGVEVTFEHDGARIVASPAASLLEVAEGGEQAIEAGCRMGVCGADPVAILAGAEHLSAQTADERATLERLGLDPSRNRLACCARVSGPVTISLRPDREAVAAGTAMAFAFDPAVRRVVVLGNGVAGVTAADHVRRRHPDCEISVVASEAHPLYNRMGISRLIYGRSAMMGLHLLPDAWYEDNRITCWLNTTATAIDRDAREVRLGSGERLPYDRLILATGSKAFVPSLPGWGTPGTFVLRAADDALRIRSFVQRTGARRAAVAGGGLLGLEAAYALHKLGLKVTVLERGPWLLRRQLDARAAELLRTYLGNLGLEVELEAECAALEGDDLLARIVLRDGRELPADILLMAAGVVSATGLAVAAGIDARRGITVDPQMRTSDPSILAAGDVVEWEGGVLGLWPVAVAQAEVAAENAVGGAAAYVAPVPVTMLKVVGVELVSVGRIAADAAAGEREEIVEDAEALRYRKLVVDADDRCLGAILLGYPEDSAAVTAAVKAHAPLTEALGSVAAPA